MPVLQAEVIGDKKLREEGVTPGIFKKECGSV